MRRFERVRDLFRDRERVVDRDRSAGDALRQVLALDQFHHQRSYVVSALSRTLFEPVDGGDVRMIQRGKRLRFTRESRQAVRIVRKRLRQDLDRHVAIQPGIARPVDLPHPPFADRRGDFVDTKPGIGVKGHVTWISSEFSLWLLALPGA